MLLQLTGPYSDDFLPYRLSFAGDLHAVVSRPPLPNVAAVGMHPDGFACPLFRFPLGIRAILPSHVPGLARETQYI